MDFDLKFSISEVSKLGIDGIMGEVGRIKT